MLQILAITTPIYLLIALGYGAGRLGWFAKPDTRVLGRYVSQIAVPALLFNALSSRPLREILNGPFLLAYGLASAAVLLGVYLVQTRWRGQQPALAAMQGLGMSSSNSGYIGYPILAQLLGPVAAVGLALVMVVENLVSIPLGLALADRQQAGTRSFVSYGRALRGLLRNPMTGALLLGFGVALLGLPVPEVLARSVTLVAASASPVALFVIGGALVGLELRGIVGGVALVTMGKLVLHPLAVLGAMALITPTDPSLHGAGVLYAAVPMLSIYPVLAQRFELEGLCAAALLATTVASFFSITAWIGLLHLLQVGGL